MRVEIFNKNGVKVGEGRIEWRDFVTREEVELGRFQIFRNPLVIFDPGLKLPEGEYTFRPIIPQGAEHDGTNSTQ